MEDDEYKKEITDVLEEAKEIQKEFSLDKIDTALLIMIHQELDVIRFHNSD